MTKFRLRTSPDVSKLFINIHKSHRIMGATGSGKTTVGNLSFFSITKAIYSPLSQFINLVSGSDLRIGRGLESCTTCVQPSPAFELDGLQVTLVDTPGFDDTNQSDNDILKMLALFLSTA